MVEKTIQIRAPIQTVFNCIIDFESYPKFLTDMKQAKIAWFEDKEMEVVFKLNLIKEITYTLLFELDPPNTVCWRLKTGDLMKVNNGSWKLKSLNEELTEATYDIHIEFSLWVPSAITQTLMEKSLPITLKRFKKRAEGLAGLRTRDQGPGTNDED